MKKVSFVVDKSLQKNRIFNKDQKIIKVGSFEKYHRLYDLFKEYGYEIATHDIHKRAASDIVIYFDMPQCMPQVCDRNKTFLLALESSIIRPDNSIRSKHTCFKKVFTWNDDLVDGKKYIKINYSFSLPNEINKQLKRPSLCCLIVSNKTSKLKNELYSERKDLVQWFDRQHANDFSLYGYGWDDFSCSNSKIMRGLNKIPYIRGILYLLKGRQYSVYKGIVESKFDTMKEYKFAIAYENVKDENGYITEKIFDVFIAGCVPIYLGAKNISEYIPKNCFIDRREFKNNEELYRYMKDMPDDIYVKYLENIENYLQSDKANPFSSDYFAETIVEGCLNKK